MAADLNVISVYNMKGGVGKTTTVFNLGVELVKFEKQALLIDFDPNNYLSLYLDDKSNDNIYGLLSLALQGMEYDMEKYIRHNYHGFDYIPSDVSLTNAGLISTIDQMVQALQEILLRIKKLNKYKYILIDCPPSLNLLTISALAISTGLIVPVQSQLFALNSLYKSVKIAKTIHDDIELYGILITMFEHTNMAIAIEEAILSDPGFKSALFSSKISKSSKASESTYFHEIEKESQMEIEYHNVCEELLARIEHK